MSDKPFSGLGAAIDHMTQGDSQEADHVAGDAVSEELQDTNEEALAGSESDEISDDHPEEAEDAEAESEEEEDGEPEDADEQDEEAEEEPTFTVTVDGTEEEVTLTELKRGFMREAVFTQKTQAIAAQSKSLGELSQQATQRLDQLEAELSAVETMFVGSPIAPPDSSLLQTDRDAYYAQRDQYEQQQNGLKQVTEWRQKLQGERQQAVQTQQAERAKAEFDHFVKAFDIKDEVGLNAKIGEVHAYLQSVGYSAEELKGMVDHKSYIVADEARKYRELMAGAKPKAAAKLAKSKIKPSSSKAAQRKPKQTNKRDQAQQRFNEATGPNSRLTRKQQLDAAAELLANGDTQ